MGERAKMFEAVVKMIEGRCSLGAAVLFEDVVHTLNPDFLFSLYCISTLFDLEKQIKMNQHSICLLHTSRRRGCLGAGLVEKKEMKLSFGHLRLGFKKCVNRNMLGHYTWM